jgi:hypothetical protein
MKIRQFGPQHLMRTAVLATILASLVLAAPTGVSANDSSTNGTTQIQVCEAMGGDAKVYTDMSSNHYTVIVECKGGAMDGFNCINDTDEASGNSFTECTQTRLVFGDERYTLLGVIDIKSPEVPAQEPIGGVIEVPQDIAPVEQVTEAVSEPTPEPTVEPVTDPVISDPVVSSPVVSDGDGASAEPTEEAGDGGAIIDVVLDDKPEINDSVSTGEEAQEPVKQLEPIQIDGLPTR